MSLLYVTLTSAWRNEVPGTYVPAPALFHTTWNIYLHRQECRGGCGSLCRFSYQNWAAKNGVWILYTGLRKEPHQKERQCLPTSRAFRWIGWLAISQPYTPTTVPIFGRFIDFSLFSPSESDKRLFYPQPIPTLLQCLILQNMGMEHWQRLGR